MSDLIVEQFCTRHPDQVAGVLRGQNQGEVASFLTALPAATASRVMSRLDSQLLSSCLLSMPPSVLARIIAAADHEDSVEIISHLPNTRYDELITSDPDEQREVAARLYAYSRKTLGAIAGPEFIRVKSGQLCNDVRRGLAGVEGDRDFPLYLVDAGGVLLGTVPPLALISETNANVEVDKIMQPIQPLSEHTTVGAALDARQWSNHSVLPVIDANQRLIGTVSRAQLLRLALREENHGYGLPELAGDLVSEYLNSCSSLLELVLERDRRDEH